MECFEIEISHPRSSLTSIKSCTNSAKTETDHTTITPNIPGTKNLNNVETPSHTITTVKSITVGAKSAKNETNGVTTPVTSDISNVNDSETRKSVTIAPDISSTTVLSATKAGPIVISAATKTPSHNGQNVSSTNKTTVADEKKHSIGRKKNSSENRLIGKVFFKF